MTSTDSPIASTAAWHHGQQGTATLKSQAQSWIKKSASKEGETADQGRGVIFKPSLNGALLPSSSLTILEQLSSGRAALFLLSVLHFNCNILKDLKSDLSPRLLKCMTTLLCISVSPFVSVKNGSNFHSSSFLVIAPFLS